MAKSKHPDPNSYRCEEDYLEALLRFAIDNPNSMGDMTKQFPLFSAAAEGDIGALKSHLRSGIDIDMKTPDTKWTALMVACYWGQVEVAKLLLKHGADSELRSSAGINAYDIALSRDQLSIATLLKK